MSVAMAPKPDRFASDATSFIRLQLPLNRLGRGRMIAESLPLATGTGGP
jgi:hypothetical protein